MSDFRTRNRSVAVKLEATPGEDAAPTLGANAVRFENPRMEYALDTERSEEVTGSLDRFPSQATGGGARFTGRTIAKGPGTPGQAPESGVLFRASAMAETLLASDVSGMAQAGAQGEITLAPGDGANAAIGQVVTLTGDTGSGQTRVIRSVDSGTDIAGVYPDWDTPPDATSQYTVHASALYVPASSALENQTIYQWRHNTRGGAMHRLDKLLGGAGTWQLEVQTRRIARFSWTFNGKLGTPQDVADPGAPSYDDVQGVPFMDADVFLGGSRIRFNQLRLDYGGEVQQADDPGDAYGVDVGAVTERLIQGSLNPPLSQLSVRDVLSDFLAATESPLWVRWGNAPGRRLSIFLPAIRPMVPEDEDVNGFGHETIPFEANGIDTGVYILAY
jgi:hypothetical protein